MSKSLYEYGNTKEMKTIFVKPKAMDLVINQLLERPHTATSLIQKIGVYSASQVGRCLRQLKKAGLIGAVKDPKKKALVYYNIGLGAVNYRVKN